MFTGMRLLSLATLLLLGAASAMPASATHLVAGGKLGWTNSDLHGANDGGINTKNSALLGVIFGWEIKPWFAVQFEPDVTAKGATLEGYSFGDLPTSLKVTYVELPVLAKFKRNAFGDPRGGYFGSAGPSVGVRTHATADYAGSNENINDLIQGFDLGLRVGGGVDIPTGEWVTTLGVSYEFGLVDVFDSSAPRQDITGDLKNRAWEVTVGVFKIVH